MRVRCLCLQVAAASALPAALTRGPQQLVQLVQGAGMGKQPRRGAALGVALGVRMDGRGGRAWVRWGGCGRDVMDLV